MLPSCHINYCLTYFFYFKIYVSLVNQCSIKWYFSIYTSILFKHLIRKSKQKYNESERVILVYFLLNLDKPIIFLILVTCPEVTDNIKRRQYSILYYFYSKFIYVKRNYFSHFFQTPKKKNTFIYFYSKLKQYLFSLAKVRRYHISPI